MTKKEAALYVRNFTFGVEDSLVSTVGLLSGIAVAGVGKSDIFITGMVLIFVEALSMGSGSFLSEHTSEEVEARKDDTPVERPFLGALVMFFSYLGSGFIPLAPYIIFPVRDAFGISIIMSLLGLMVLGIINAKVFKMNILKHAFEMLAVGGISIVAGVVVGKFIGK
ncbi:VIT1/CCC1 transporter family protein [Candidatus Microgenomates bacterium]|nr:VIT1/CCC1 transporter family protein [Candidatus Microgenomates bacterium]